MLIAVRLSLAFLAIYTVPSNAIWALQRRSIERIHRCRVCVELGRVVNTVILRTKEYLVLHSSTTERKIVEAGRKRYSAAEQFAIKVFLEDSKISEILPSFDEENRIVQRRYIEKVALYALGTNNMKP